MKRAVTRWLLALGTLLVITLPACTKPTAGAPWDEKRIARERKKQMNELQKQFDKMQKDFEKEHRKKD